MNINFKKKLKLRYSPIVSWIKSRGLVSIDVLITMLVTGTLVGLAGDFYLDAVEKQLIVTGADQIEAFIGSVQSRSITHNRRALVSYQVHEDGRWCIGATHKKTPCNCLQTEVTKPDYCAIESATSILRHTHVQGRNLLHFSAGEGAFAFDPVRRLMTGSFDSMVLGLQSGGQKFQMELRVNALGEISRCVPEGSESIRQYEPCLEEK